MAFSRAQHLSLSGIAPPRPADLRSILRKTASALAIFSIVTPNLGAFSRPVDRATVEQASGPGVAVSPAFDGPALSMHPWDTSSGEIASGHDLPGASQEQVDARSNQAEPRPRNRPLGTEAYYGTGPALLTPTPTPEPGEIAIPDVLPPGGLEQLQAPQAFGAQPLSAGPAADTQDRQIASGSSDQTYPAVVHNPNDGTYLVVWADDSAPGALRGTLLTSAGNPLDSDFLIASASVGIPFRPELVHNPTDDTFMLVWSEPNGGVSSETYCDGNCVTAVRDTFDLYAVPLEADGHPSATAPTLLTSQLTFWDVRLGYGLVYNSSANEFLAVWEQPRGILGYYYVMPHRIKGQRLDPSANPIGSAVDMVVGVTSSISVAYSSASDEYFVTYDNQVFGPANYELYGQRFDPTSLTPVGSLLSITGGSLGPQLFARITYAGPPDTYYVIYESSLSLTTYVPLVAGRFIDGGTGDLLPFGGTVIDDDDPVYASDVAYSPLDNVFQVMGLIGGSQLTVRYVSPTGDLLTDLFLHTELPVAWPVQARLAPRLVGSERNRRWLVAWNTSGDIYARFSTNPQLYDGAVLGPSGAACLANAAVQSQGFEAAPINTRTGGYSYAVEDLSFPTSAGALSFRRSYASLAATTLTEPLGFGWTHNHLARLIFPADPGGEPGVVLFQADTANRVEFIDNEDGTFTAGLGVCGELIGDDGPPVTYTVTDEAQRTYAFDGNGRLQTWADAQGRSWTYSYDLAGRLASVEDDSAERSLTFDYDAEGRLILVEDHTGRSVAFSYDANGDLVSATDVLGQSWSYLYDTEHRLTEVIDPRGVTVERTEYDDQGRAVRQFDGLGNLVVEITYNPDGTSAIVDARGSSQTHAYDYRKTLTDETDAAGETSGKIYDLNFRRTSITDEDGDVTELSWSPDGANLNQVIDAEGGQTDLSYDELNNLTQVVDPRGFTTSYNYDGTLLQTSTDALGNTTSYTYTPEGFLASVTDPRGNTTRYAYDEFGQRTSMTDAHGSSWTYSYDDLGRLVDTTDPLGRVTYDEYDPASRLIRVTRNYDPDQDQNDDEQFNIVTEHTYDEVGNQIAVTDTFGRPTTYQYDEANRLMRTVDPQGNETTNEYDEAGNLIATTDPLGRTTTYAYDELNRLVETTDPLGQTTATAYNPDGTVASMTDALGRTTGYQYDDLKRVIVVTDALGNETTTTYGESGNVVATTDALGKTTSFAYDELSRLTLQTDPQGGVTQHFYDDAGNRIRTIDPRGYTTRFGYDRLNQLSSVTDALDNRTDYTYDEVGKRIEVEDANSNITVFTYDDLDRLVETMDPLGNTIETHYDAVGKVVERWDANFNVTRFEYDMLDRLNFQTDPLGAETATFYDEVGNLVETIDPNGHSSFTEYDALNRPVYVTDPNGNTTATEYDAVGNVVASVDPLGNLTTFGYDELNRQVSASDPLGNVTEYGYDAVGNRTSMTDANGVVTRYEYDDLNRLAAVVENFIDSAPSDHETNVRTEYTYDENGNRLTILDGNGHVTTFTYDALNRLTNEADPLGNETSYEYDPIGSRASLTDAEGFTTYFIYDDANRLVGIDYPAPDEDVIFSYDAVGNRTLMDDDVTLTTWVYDELNRVIEVTDPFDGVVGYGYDPVGNRTLLTYPDGKGVDYAYDPANRLELVTDWDLQDTTYSYDAVGRLLTAELPNGVVSSYDYDDAGRLLSIFHQAGAEVLSSFEYSYDPNGNRTQVQEYYQTPGAGPTVVVEVADERGDPMPGIPVYVFDGATYTGFNKTTDESGKVSITLPAGNYRFRADVDGVQFWSGAENHCEIAGCTGVLMTIPDPVLVVVQDTGGTPKAGLPVYVFEGTTYTGRSGTTDANGEVSLRLPEGEYDFRVDFNGTQFWNDAINHCPVPGCTLAGVIVTIPVVVTVEDSLGMPQQGLPVYAFSGGAYTGYNKTTDANGQAVFTLPMGDYRFRADSGGTQFWSGETDHCSLPGCLDATVMVTPPVTVTVEDTDSQPKAGLPVYVFDGATYTNFHATTDGNGDAEFTLPEGSYRFRADFNGTQFWSGQTNHCAVPGCSSATVVVTLPVTVTVEDTDGQPKAGLPVYVFDGTTYTNYHSTTDGNGEAEFTLPQGSYRFRADFNGTQFWSGTANHCTIPGCESAIVVVTIPVTITVQDWGGAPLEAVPV